MLATPELLLERAQRYKLAEVVPRCLRNVPLYAGLQPEELYSGPEVDFSHFQRLPLVSKPRIREGFPHNFLGEGKDLQRLLEEQVLELEYTSGTSEERTPLLLDAGWWAEQERRALLLNSTVAGLLEANPDTRRVTIVSPACSNDIVYTGVPSCGERTLGNTLFVTLSRFPFLWSDHDLARMTREAVAWQPTFLDVDPVYAVPFALYCERRSIRIPSLRFIIASYEFVSVVHRRILERVFGVPVLNLYGSTETGHLLMEADSGEMRPSLETAYLEVIDLDARGVGNLVVTTLTNQCMPLLRYDIGDLVRPLTKPYGTRYELHGRAADSLSTPAGRVTVLDIDRCLVGINGIAHYQLAQQPSGAIRLRYIPEGSGPSLPATQELRERLSGVLSLDAPAIVEPASGLLAEKSGKFRLVYPAPERV